jgi:hypothetical protein
METRTQPQFTIPLELLKEFKQDVRIIPPHLPANGWILFDKAMLVSVLRNENSAIRAQLANGIEQLDKAGGNLVIIQTPAA